MNLQKAETRGYNDCKKGITTCPYKQEELQIFWNRGFGRAYEEKVYQVTRPSANSNLIVKELNVNVFEETFKSKEGPQKADWYTSKNECDCLIAHDTCPPVNMHFRKTVLIKF